ncbi:Pre-mRNA-splicing factor srp2 [Fulvia fulva]|uniref:Pre-mRNA-splicing factor srp2 n=1 Tax=Passalora fulva TaxID=5499 RepID=A0A9Q8PCV9_PASFU|nr:Pre-mRNA-splicing factor srp2 [Fulvia fulva]KAK4619984.1 Pre-mRNA-splicing factor srp2 [Fulvia fulva]KAK4620682.1 Pre-mRNA-splicing factor srp2 [Fulvia fulva]UJO20148.1 Pre-mRNA-splicing factor srp2 [Fulvia fulva]WPV17276.1 Pre-mRNA-splicing factor srp2 [Fulvia fulva]WPV31983.1 Pre-mRNA-splicing factor srp2 [Fulvia fulva]
MADAGVSNTRLYLGNLPRNATKADVENHFNTHGTGEIMEIKLMNGFGFIEYKDAMDARDVVPDGSEFMGERLVVQFARGSNRPREGFEHQPRMAPRPRRTVHRMTITGLPFETSWQDLKDFARQSGLDVVYSEVNRERDPSGTGKGYVEYETAADLATAVEKLDNSEFKGSNVRCISDPQTEIPRPRERYRSRSPGGYRGRGGYGGGPPPGGDDYYDRRGPPRGYSPRRDDYRRRTPPPRGYYDDPRDDRYGPPRGGRPSVDDYPPPRGGGYPDDRYGPPPPRRGGYEPEPYANGHGREPYAGRPASPRREGGGYERRGGYEARPYW